MIYKGAEGLEKYNNKHKLQVTSSDLGREKQSGKAYAGLLRY